MVCGCGAHGRRFHYTTLLTTVRSGAFVMVKMVDVVERGVVGGSKARGEVGGVVANVARSVISMTTVPFAPASAPIMPRHCCRKRTAILR